MPKYRVLGKKVGSHRRDAWDIISAKSPSEAIKKAKEQVKKYGKRGPKYTDSGWVAIKA